MYKERQQAIQAKRRYEISLGCKASLRSHLLPGPHIGAPHLKKGVEFRKERPQDIQQSGPAKVGIWEYINGPQLGQSHLSALGDVMRLKGAGPEHYET